jgi:hypothetical protein
MNTAMLRLIADLREYVAESREEGVRMSVRDFLMYRRLARYLNPPDEAR